MITLGGGEVGDDIFEIDEIFLDVQAKLQQHI